MGSQSFLFTDNGHPVGVPVRTLKEFVAALANCAPSVLDGHARRGDFSRWIADTFHDQPLTLEVQNVKQRYLLGRIQDLHHELAKPILGR